MLDLTLIEVVGIMIVAAAASLLVLRLVNVPSIVVYIVVGLVMGAIFDVLPADMFAGEADDGVAETIRLIAEVGIALLLFLVGLELSFEKIRDVGGVATLMGLAQVALTGAGAFLITLLLGFALLPALFIAIAMTNSSTVLAVKLLEQKRQTHELHGHVAVGMNLAKDLVLIVVMTFLAALEPGEPFDLARKGGTLLLVFLGLGLMLGTAALASRYALARPFRWAARSPQTLLIWSLGWCFLFVVGSEVFGLSPAIGAFIAGLSLAQLDCADELRRRVHPLMSFFLAIFFIAIGAQMEIGGILAHGLATIALSVCVLVSVPLLSTWLLGRTGYSQRTSFLAGVSMAQVSELAFVLAAVGLAAGVVDQDLMSMIAMIGLITIVVSSYLILYNESLYARTHRFGLLTMLNARTTPEQEPTLDTMREHVIVIGMNALGQRIARDLHSRGEVVLAVDTDPTKLAEVPTRTLVGNVDHLSLLEAINLHEAKLVVSALQIEDTNRLLAYQCKQLGVPAAIHALDEETIAELRRLGVDRVIDSKAEGGRILEMQLRRLEAADA